MNFPAARNQSSRTIAGVDAHRGVSLKLDVRNSSSERSHQLSRQSTQTNNDHVVQIDSENSHPDPGAAGNHAAPVGENNGSTEDALGQSSLTGYPFVAAFLSSDPRKLIYRRFDQARNRVILQRQADIMKLELQLHHLEKAAAPKTLRSFKEQDPAVTKLIDDLDEKLERYDKLLLREAKLLALGRPSTRYRKRVVKFLAQVKPLEPSETRFLRYEDDLLPLAKDLDEPWVYRRIEQFRRLYRWYMSGVAGIRRIHPIGAYRERKTVAKIGRALAALVSMVLLGVPIGLMSTLPFRRWAAFLMIMGFTVLFTAVIFIFERPRKQELFVSTATYFAVLAVNLASLPA